MKCPKCQYLNFDEGERCRNCGYDLTLALDLPPPIEPPVEPPAGSEGPLLDLPLSASAAEGPRSGTPAPLSRGRTPRLELPLFGTALVDARGVPLAPSPPRPPLAVRRRTPEPPRPSAPRRRPMPMLALLTPAAAAEAPTETKQPAPWPRRAVAAAIDFALLAGLDAAVIAFTLRLAGLTLRELHVVPPLPLGAFLLLLDGGYLVSFTALGGQSLGKMLAGIRVLGRAGHQVGVGAASLRTVSLLLGLLPFGAGLLPALFDGERRALHDRLAGTRVVRV